MTRRIIPYNPHLKPLAKKLWQHITFSEVKRWNELKNGKMPGYDFDRQRPIGNYIVDFYGKDLQLAIEVNGITHDKIEVAQKDAVRQNGLESLGVAFLRYNALLILNDVEAALKDMARRIERHEK